MKKSSESVRLDQFLLQKGLAPTRSKAQELIDEGDVEVFLSGQWQAAKGSSQTISWDGQVRLIDEDVLKYVSRGGRKLEGALDDFKINVSGQVCLDLGQSTGGFTDCLLQRGAREVVGVDVGHQQLHEKIRRDSRVKFFEGLHIQDLKDHAGFREQVPKKGFDLIVGDLSFISVLNGLEHILPWGHETVLLIKPQFESSEAKKKQLVFDEKMFENLRVLAGEKLQAVGWKLCNVSLARIRGKDGNQEFFVHAKK